MTSFGDDGRTKFALRVALACRVSGIVERGEGDFPVPIAVGVVVAAGVEDAVGDGVVADFFAVAVTKKSERLGAAVATGSR